MSAQRLKQNSFNVIIVVVNFNVNQYYILNYNVFFVCFVCNIRAGIIPNICENKITYK